MCIRDRVKPSAPAGNAGKMGLDEIETANIRFGYCTEFIVMLEKPFDEKDEDEMCIRDRYKIGNYELRDSKSILLYDMML